MVSVAFEETAHSRTSSQSSAVGRWLQLAHRSADSLYADLRSAAAAGGADAIATVCIRGAAWEAQQAAQQAEWQAEWQAIVGRAERSGA